MTTPGTRDRYAQCDNTCTVDCGACKGAGRPAPAAEGTDGLREALARTLATNLVLRKGMTEIAGALLAGPLADLIRERDEAVAKVAAVEGLAELHAGRYRESYVAVDDLRRALDA